MTVTLRNSTLPTFLLLGSSLYKKEGMFSFLLLLSSNIIHRTVSDAWNSITASIQKIQDISNTFIQSQQSIVAIFQSTSNSYDEACKEIREDYERCLKQRESAQQEVREKFDNYQKAFDEWDESEAKYSALSNKPEASTDETKDVSISLLINPTYLN